MKKLCKRGGALLLMVFLLLSLSGCAWLDQMRERQAFFETNGDIIHNGVTYKLLPSSEYLSPVSGIEDYVYVTEPDVPVLLIKEFYLEELSLSTDGSFLFDLYGSGNIYCREEIYDAVCDRIRGNFTADMMCYSYYAYDMETNTFHDTWYYLSQEQMDAVYQVMDAVEPMVMGNGWYLEYEHKVRIEERSKDMLFRRSRLEISVAEGTYYLTCSTGANTLIYTIPQERETVFAQILQAYIAS